MEFKHIKNILVMKLRHIGDVLLTVPVFRALRENFPQAFIGALVNSGTEEVLRGNPLIDEVFVFERNIKKINPLQRFREEFAFMRRLRSKGFDMAVDLTSGDRPAIMSFLSGARYRLAYDPEREGFFGKRHLYTHLAQKDGSEHMVLQNLNIIKQFGLSTDDLTVDFFVPAEAKEFVQKVFQERGIKGNDRIVHIHPTSRWFFKCWKDESMGEVISWLLGSGVKVIVTSSPAKKEMEKTGKILAMLGNQGGLIDLCGQTNIKQLAALAKSSDLFFGVDSAPMHIAAAVGTPVIALFGPTGEAQWGPWGKNHRVIAKDIGCKPCQPVKCKGLELRPCLEQITTKEVIEVLASTLRLQHENKLGS